MGMFDSQSDRDYYDAARGPYAETVERECCVCRTVFTMVVEGEYVMHPVCARCEVEQRGRNAAAKREQEQDTPIKRGVA